MAIEQRFQRPPGSPIPHSPLTMSPRPWLDALRTRFREDPRGMGVATLMAAIFTMRSLARPGGLLLTVVLVPCTLVAMVAGYSVWAKRSRLELRNGLLVRQTMLRSITVRTDDLVGAVRFTLAGPMSRSTRRVCLLDSHGFAVLSWTTALWPEDDVVRLLSALRVEVEDVPETVTARESRERWAGSSSSFERHPWGFSCLGIALISAVIVSTLGLLGEL